MASRALVLKFPHLPPGALKRALAAGSAWGIVFGLGLTAFGFWQCRTICIGDAAMTTAVSIAAGILTIGPLAAFGRRSDPAAR
jgi:Mg/Co/Ni transporter MgtE